MQVSTKLFNEQSVRQFGKITEDVQNLQAKVSTGKNILRSSDDPVAAVELSAAKEQKNILDRFKRNVDSAQRRLDLADGTMQQAINVMTRISELAIQAVVGNWHVAMLIHIPSGITVISGKFRKGKSNHD